MKSEFLKKLKIPDNPGVYFFLKGKEIIYIGKATFLRDRVKSYFGKDLIATRGPIILDMIFKADKIKWETTDSVLEAIILEANLIKKHQPKYNTKEKSDKSFNYVVITREKLPKVVTIRGRDLAKKHSIFPRLTLPRVRGGTLPSKNPNVSFSGIYGPFTSGPQLKEGLKIIRKIFPFLDDKAKNYLEFYRQINLIPDLNDRKMYLQNIRNIKLFFSGKKKQILQNLKKEMKVYAKNKEFERAGEIKRQLFALQHINDIALLKLEPSIYTLGPVFRIEAYDIAHMGGKNMVGVMTVVEDGQVNKGEYKKFKIRTQSNTNDTGALAEVLERRFNHPEWKFPDLIVVDGSTAQINVAESILKRLKSDIPVIALVKDDRHKMRELKGDSMLIKKYKRDIMLANSEAHRFAINYHKNVRNKNFLENK